MQAGSVDMLGVVSSAPQALAGLRERLGAVVGEVVFLDSGVACLEWLAACDPQRTVVLIDDTPTDLSPMNLAGAIASRFPAAGVVLLVADLTSESMQRAMLAGARSVVERSRWEADIVSAVQRAQLSGVTRSSSVRDSVVAADPARSGRVVAVVSGKGGVGKTTWAAVAAECAHRRVPSVALVDLDLQFGDLSFVYAAQPKYTLSELVEADASVLPDYAHVLPSGIHLFSPSPRPEEAEVVAPRLSVLLAGFRQHYDLTVCNTGAFWTLLHAELLDSADFGLFLMTQDAVSVRATVVAKALCRRLGIPDAKLGYCVNRYSPKGRISLADVQAALGVGDVHTLPEADYRLAEFFDAGDASAYVDAGGSYVKAVDALLTARSAGIGLPAVEMDAPQRKSRFRR